MKSFTFGDVVGRWNETYLTGRVSRVSGDLSGTIPMRSSVGPLLFSLFTKRRLWADIHGPAGFGAVVVFFLDTA